MRVLWILLGLLVVAACSTSICQCPRGDACSCAGPESCGPDTPCAPGLICSTERGNTCQLPPESDAGSICTPLATTCDGPNLLTCTGSGLSWTVTALCGSGCVDGACVTTDAGLADAGDVPEPCTIEGLSGTCDPMFSCATGITRPGTCDGAAREACCLPSEPATPRCPSTDTPRVNAAYITPPAGLGACPAGMAPIGDAFCIDRWEASLVVSGDDGPASWSPYATPGEALASALSVPDAVPQAHVSQVAAAAACARSGKRLCSNDEWLRACRGPEDRAFPYGSARIAGTCHDESTRSGHPAVACFASTDPSVFTKLNDPGINQAPDALAPTGSYAGCVTSEGVFDLVGNLHEWTSDPAGTFRGGFYFDTRFNGEGCAYKTTAHDVAYADYSTGFRCCADLP